MFITSIKSIDKLIVVEAQIPLILGRFPIKPFLFDVGMFRCLINQNRNYIGWFSNENFYIDLDGFTKCQVKKGLIAAMIKFSDHNHTPLMADRLAD